MFFSKLLFSLLIFFIIQLFFTTGAWAWGPAIHTAIACGILNEIGHVLPAIASIIQPFSLEYIYGNMAADFFIGKGQKKKDGHSHNWDTGFKLLEEAKDERDLAYVYGFLSHLAADVIAHNYFVPDLIHRASTWKRWGHFYSEAMADKLIGPYYSTVAKDVLSMDRLECDDLLKTAVKRSKRGLKAKRHIFTQSVKMSDYLYYLPSISINSIGSRYHIPYKYLSFMIELSYRLARDVLSYPDSSPCLSHDPIGTRNLRLASENGLLSKIFNYSEQPSHRFPIDKKLLDI